MGTKIITTPLLLFLFLTSYSQSLDIDQIYATQYKEHIFLEGQKHTKVKKIGNKTIHVLESNKNAQITRELTRLSDTTFLYTEYFPMSYEQYVKSHGEYGIYQQGILLYSNETVTDSTVLYNYDTYEAYPNPREKNILKPIGTWVEKYYIKFNRIRGSFNEKGKHGEWVYYTKRVQREKKLTYENGILVSEEYYDILPYKLREKTREIIARKWAIHPESKTMNTNFSKDGETCTFESNGVFTKSYKVGPRVTQKGVWLLKDHDTIEITLDGQKTILNLKYLSEKQVKYQ